MKSRRFLRIAVELFALWLGVSAQGATLIQNGDFETGLFGPWTLFTTPGGDISDTFNTVPAVRQFDVTGLGSNTFAVVLSVGRDRFNGLSGPQGGGLFQSFLLAAATTIELSADVAAQYDFPVGGNNDGGTFELVLDGVVLNTWTSGVVLAHQLLRNTLAGTITNLPAGNHEVRITILRDFDQADDLYQYIDDVMVVAVPEPTPCQLLISGFSVLGAVWIIVHLRYLRPTIPDGANGAYAA
jgi:hypothetical protein